MRVDIRWENQAKNIIRVDCDGAWVWEDMARAIQSWRASQNPPPQHPSIIVDLRKITMPSDAVLRLKDAASSAGTVNGQIVVIISSSAIAVLFKVFLSMYWKISKKFQAASSEEEAYRLLGIIPEPSAKSRL